MIENEFAHLIDGVNTVQVAVALGHSPSEETVAAKNEALAAGIVFDGAFDHESQFESRTLPGNPDDLAAKFFIELIQLAFAIRACCESDGPVRMQVIHVREGKKRMQRSVNRCRHAILAKGRKRIVADHFIFVLFAAV